MSQSITVGVKDAKSTWNDSASMQQKDQGNPLINPLM